jgi:hypothetical protein
MQLFFAVKITHYADGSMVWIVIHFVKEPRSFTVNLLTVD